MMKKWVKAEEITTEQEEWLQKWLAQMVDLLNRTVESEKASQAATQASIQGFIDRGEMERGVDGKLRVPRKLILLKKGERQNEKPKEQSR
jgi:hypothetical protein